MLSLNALLVPFLSLSFNSVSGFKPQMTLVVAAVCPLIESLFLTLKILSCRLLMHQRPFAVSSS